MANFYRVMRSVVWFFIGVSIVAWPMLSRAETKTSSGGVTVTGGSSEGSCVVGSLFVDRFRGKSYGSKDELLAAVRDLAGKSWVCANTPLTFVDAVYSGTRIRVSWTWKDGMVVYTVASLIDYSSANYCEVGWTLSDDGKSCSRPDCGENETRQSDGTCKSNCAAGISAGSSSSVYNVAGKVSGNTLCIAGCTVTADTCGASAKAGGSVKTTCLGPFVETGASCVASTSTSEAPKDSAEYTCAKQGKCSGTVNGVAVCVPCDTSTSKGSSTEKKKDTNTDKDGNSSSSSSGSNTETTTTCTNGVCTTKKVTTTTNPDGSTSVEESEETQDQPGFCEENSTLAICKEGTFSGACSAGAAPSCEGDAVQCAQAVAVWKLECSLSLEPDSDAYKLGKSLSNGGADPAGNPLSAENTKEVNVESIVLGAAGERSLSGQCISSPSFSVAGHSYTLDVTQFCEFASIVGYLMVAASSVIAIRMVTAGA